MRLEGKIIKYNDDELPSNFVSIAVVVNDNKEAFHGAILIRHRSRDYLFHYPGSEPPLIEFIDGETGQILIYKILENFDTEDDTDVGAFLRHCERVCIETDITYGFIFDGSTYATDGRYQSISGLPEIATCVGFCVNVLSNFVIDISDSYFHLEDWDDNGVIEKYDIWAQQETQRKYPSLDWNLYNSFKKRISPLEYLCSAFCEVYPIHKATIAQIQPFVDAELQRIC